MENLCEKCFLALTGDLRNAANECIEGIRPRAQYFKLYRTIIPKLSDLIDNWQGPEDKKQKILEIRDYLLNSELTHKTQLSVSHKILSLLC